MSLITTVDPNFLSTHTTLQKQAAANAVALSNGGYCVAQRFGDIAANNFMAVHTAFSRSAIEQAYQQVPQGKASIQDNLVLKAMSDWLSRCERDFRMRDQSRIGAICAEASRRQGHGNPMGVINYTMLGSMKSMLSRTSPLGVTSGPG